MTRTILVIIIAAAIMIRHYHDDGDRICSSVLVGCSLWMDGIKLKVSRIEVSSYLLSFTDEKPSCFSKQSCSNA
jgi:hypothetical protein